MSLSDLFTEIILDHYQHPHNHGVIEDATQNSRGYNESCGDDIEITVLVKNGIVEDAKFSGAGCSISQASASIMTDLVKGKSLDEVRRIAEKFYAMVKGAQSENGNESDVEELGDAVALRGVSKFPVRVKCATLSWHTLEEAFKTKEKK
ncbi:MAG TPA: SUF system NifU family Fe-S cluster assembly protein [Candidatus Acidoferrales bacterium]|nr:SUF system NifU family Fe-S cluster assembly protein [Candidatus Acidoferrales bacterium]